jgi:sugar-specific transcriptional regulator TrmB
MIHDKIVQLVSNLGLTTKQAKVYASILVNGIITVPEISRRTGIHEQDIYKIIKNLEKLGVVTRTAFKPIKVEPIPIEKALYKLIEAHQKVVDSERNNVEEIISQIIPIQKKETIEGQFALLPAKTRALDNRAEIVFEKINKTYDCFVPKDRFLFSTLSTLVEKTDLFLEHNIASRILVSNCNAKELGKILSKEKKLSCDIVIKNLNTTARSFYAIIDNQEVWIPTDLKGEKPVLVTDAVAIVRLAREHFESHWDNKKTDIVLQNKQNNQFQAKEK